MGEEKGAANRPRVGVAYIRVSKVNRRGEVDDEGVERLPFYSPEIQEEIIAQHFERTGIAYNRDLGWECQDLDVSAAKEGSWEKRPGLRRLLEAARRGEFTDLCVYKLSRIARNIRDGLEIIQRFAEAGVTVHFAADPHLKHKQIDSSFGRLLLVLHLWVAEAEKDTIGDNARNAIAKRWREGKPHGGWMRGWLRMVGKHQYELDPERLPAYRRMIELALAHRSYTEIARTLNVEGYRTARNVLWSHTQISLLLCPRGIAMMRGGAFKGRADKNGGAHQKPEPAYANHFPALITEEEAAALRLFYGRIGDRTFATKKIRRSVRKHGRHMLAGKVYCSICKCEMTMNTAVGRDGKNYSIYTCLKGRQGHPAHLDDQGNKKNSKISVKAENVEEAVARVVRAVLKEPPPSPAPPKERQPRRATGRTLDQVDAEIARVLDLYVKGTVPEEFLNDQMEELNAARTTLLAEEQKQALSDAEQAVLDRLARKAVEDGDADAVRQTVTVLVERASFPHEVQSRRNSNRAVLVRLIDGREFLAPVHFANYQKQRVVIPLLRPEADVQADERVEEEDGAAGVK